jgi:hypothetical protein
LSLNLVALDCPVCGSALRARPLDILFLCDHCGAGAVLAEQGLELVESIALVASPGRKTELWRPAWLIEGTVSITDRIRSDGLRTADWHGRHSFVIPAFALDLGALTRLAEVLSAAAADTGKLPGEPIPGGILSLSDATIIARQLVVAHEVRKPDMLASLNVGLEVSRSRLAATPFAREGDRLRCAITGHMVQPEE